MIEADYSVRVFKLQLLVEWASPLFLLCFFVNQIFITKSLEEIKDSCIFIIIKYELKEQKVYQSSNVIGTPIAFNFSKTSFSKKKFQKPNKQSLKKIQNSKTIRDIYIQKKFLIEPLNKHTN